MQCWAVFLRKLDDESKKLSTTSQTSAPQLCRARALVEENKINFNPKMHIFNVDACRTLMMLEWLAYILRKNVAVQQGVYVLSYPWSKAQLGCTGNQII